MRLYILLCRRLRRRRALAILPALVLTFLSPAGLAAAAGSAGRPAATALAGPLRPQPAWLVLQGGRRIQTEGPWELKGDLLTVHEPSGRILTVATGSIDAASCLRVNPRLRIVASPQQMGDGAPAAVRQIWPEPEPNPAIPASHENRALATATLAPFPGTADLPTPPPPASPSPNDTPDETLAARKRARQAELRRELAYRQIVEGCGRMFVIDRAGFRRCVDAQAPPAP